MRALFLAPWPSDAASTRLRVEQYFPHLREHGIEPTLRSFMSPDLYRMVYDPGQLRRKVGMVLQSTARRVVDLVTAARADVVFVHREAFPFGTTLVERTISALGVPMILDFDDAIYLDTGASAPHRFVRQLKRPDKVSQLIRMSRAVIVGNEHLGKYAREFSNQVVVLPTPVDTDVYRPREARKDRSLVTIGWIGSGTTSHYLDTLTGPVARLLEKYPQVRVSVVGGHAHELEKLPGVTFQPWALANELATLHSFDIGLMPYPDTEWARGKCAFKALLYMTVGIPTVSSAIGMAEEVIHPGLNGYLAREEQDWFEALEALVVSHELRKKLGEAGRELAVTDFSLKSYAPRLRTIVESVARGEAVPSSAPRPVTALVTPGQESRA